MLVVFETVWERSPQRFDAQAKKNRRALACGTALPIRVLEPREAAPASELRSCAILNDAPL
jgi:hypothetical protein